MYLVDYKNYIVSNGFVSESKSDYYVNWVKRFLRLNLPAKLSHSEKLRQFEESLLVDNVADWQLIQARHAVELYLNMFLSHIEAKRATSTPLLESLLRELRNTLRVKHYAYRTEQTYVDWVKRYFDFCTVKGLDMKADVNVKLFLTELAVKNKVAAGTQNQAFNALLFLFRYIFELDLDNIKDTVRAKGKRHIPVVLSLEEVKLLISVLDGTERLIVELIYGTGLRVSELTRLRVMDIDFANGIVRVVDGKGGKDRAVPLPHSLEDRLRQHLAKVKELHNQDLAIGFGEVWLPPALARKYRNAGREWQWQYLFPSAKLSTDPRSGKTRRHHILDNTVQRIVKKAVRRTSIDKKVTVHTLRHSFATHLLMHGVNIREIQELLGHKNLETTMIYTHVVRELSTVPTSPLDLL